MPWNDSGTYILPVTSLTPDATAGTIIVSADFDTFTADIEAAITKCITGDGLNHLVSANLPMATYRHTGVGDAVALTDYASANQVVDNTLTYGADAGGDDTYALTLTINPGVYAAGNRFQVLATTGNTGACTLEVNGLGPKSIKMADGADPYNGAIQANSVFDVMYDGTNFILMNPYSEVLNTTASSTELDYLDITTLGTSQTSKAMTVSAGDAIVNTGMTWTDLGSVTTCDINGGTIDGATLGTTNSGNTEAATDDSTKLATTAFVHDVTELYTRTIAHNVTSTSSLALSTTAATPTAIGSSFSATIPTKGRITIYLDQMQVTDSSGSGNSFYLGLQIGANEFYPTHDVGSGTVNVRIRLIGGNDTDKFFGSSQHSDAASAITLSVEGSGITTGAQTVQLVGYGGSATNTIDGDVLETKVHVLIEDFT